MRRVLLAVAASVAMFSFAGSATAAARMVCPIQNELYCLTHPCTTKICTH